MDVLRQVSWVSNLRGLTPETAPHFSTACDRKQTIPMKRWRAIFDQSIELYELGDVQAIDETRVDSVQTSQYDAKRTDYMFEVVKATLLVDCDMSEILDILFDTTTSCKMSLAVTITAVVDLEMYRYPEPFICRSRAGSRHPEPARPLREGPPRSSPCGPGSSRQVRRFGGRLSLRPNRAA